MLSAISRADEFVSKNVLSHSLFSFRASHSTHFVFSGLDRIKNKNCKNRMARTDEDNKTSYLRDCRQKRRCDFFRLLYRPNLARSSESAFAVIENKIMSIRLNGYEIVEP